jgi:hypothetical protein
MAASTDSNIQDTAPDSLPATGALSVTLRPDAAAGNETVLAGNSVQPFGGVTVSDTSPDPLDGATITLTGAGGTLSGDGLAAAGATPGTYSVAATSPAALTDILHGVVFTAPALGGQDTAATGVSLSVTDRGRTASVGTTITVVAQPSPSSSSPSPPPSGETAFVVADRTSGGQTATDGDAYAGPVAGLQRQLILDTQDDVTVVARAANVFMRTGPGEDALAVQGGSNVLDGNSGSNFLVGASGADRGTDTFFTDARTNDVVWNTLVNFHTGDSATLWGFDPSVSTWHWDGVSGAAGYTGATLRADVHGTGATDASITFAGLSMAQAQGLQVATGTVAGVPYLWFHNPGV